jgi:hypothetical protein
MDKVSLLRQKTNIAQQSDIERLRTHALWLLEQCWVLSRSRPAPDNYRVDGWSTGKWIADLTNGTKDFCIGWYEGKSAEWGWLQVACGDFVVWPAEWYGLSAALSPEEKDALAAELDDSIQ